jgi:ligand-binding SRPBCC domain-containing protein
MKSITPPPLQVQFHRAPEQLKEGDQMEFSLGVGPLKIDWLACICQVSLNGFTDEQIKGPFKSWTHRHQFEQINDVTTLVKDDVQAELKNHWFWGLVGLAMWLGMPILFAYRGRKTRLFLERKPS